MTLKDVLRYGLWLGLAPALWLGKRLVAWPLLWMLDGVLWRLASPAERAATSWRALREESRRALFGRLG